jgi:tetratricopeptide (TPR) repeat protein
MRQRLSAILFAAAQRERQAMLTLYLALLAMLLTALATIASAFKFELSKSFLVVASLTLTVAFGLFHISNNTTGLRMWLTEGKAHYDLLVAFQELGGFDGTIARIKEKLKQNPNDARGWQILGKLYLAKGDTRAANKALTKARQLDTKL